jgi:hypothetical protein
MSIKDIGAVYRATSEPIDGKPVGVIISVTDTGFGIELENVHSISQLQRRKKVLGWA